MVHGRPSAHSPIPVRIELQTSALAVRILLRRLGVRTTLAVLGDLVVGQARGEPFVHLAKPIDDRERLCRKQAGPAILLHKSLRRRLGLDTALEVTREVVIAATLVFLRHTIGPLDRDRLMSLSPDERDAWVQTVAGRFFNATLVWDEISDAQVAFTVTHCRFPGLCQAGGAPEVAPLLCAGDAVYFGQTVGSVELLRPQTIAEGRESCPFTLRWKIRSGVTAS